eukprot:10120312-Lingulodinium_polyedra.AAC.1
MPQHARRRLCRDLRPSSARRRQGLMPSRGKGLCFQLTNRHSLYRRLLPMPCAGGYVRTRLEQAVASLDMSVGIGEWTSVDTHHTLAAVM